MNPGTGALLPLLLTVLLAAPLRAQGLPAYRQINPLATSRSPLAFLPLVDQAKGWRFDVGLDYMSAVELAEQPPAEIVLDMEVLRLTARGTRDLTSRTFVQIEASAWGAYAGILDGLVNWYHGLIGFDEAKRGTRPNGVFEYSVDLPHGQAISRQPAGLQLADLALSAGYRHTRHWQTALTVLLPTATGPHGYGLGTLGAGIITTARSDVLSTRFVLEGSLGVGYTPSHGDLADFQRTMHFSASSGARFRFWGQQALYVNAFLHSPLYHDTTLSPMDGLDLSLDAGFVFKPRGGPEIVAGLVEDLYVFGPAVDVTFRFAVRW